LAQATLDRDCSRGTRFHLFGAGVNMTQHGTTMAFAACSLTAAPLFIAHTSKVLAPALDRVPRHAGFPAGVSAVTCGPEMMTAVSLGGMAVAVAGIKPKSRRTKTVVRAAASEPAPEAEEPPPPPAAATI